MRRSYDLGACGAVAALSVAVSACGSTGREETSSEAARSDRSPTHSAVADPYRAALGYVACMRRHGIRLPNPDQSGNLRLAPRDERRIGPIERQDFDLHARADKECFRYLRGTVNTRPFSRRVRERAVKIMGGVSKCMSAAGFKIGAPFAKVLPRGQLALLFDTTDAKTRAAMKTPEFKGVFRTCERGLTSKLDEVFAAERDPAGY